MRTYRDQNTVGDQNVYADAVVVRPTITANDPAGGRSSSPPSSGAGPAGR